METVDPQIASEWKFSIGSEPGENPKSYIDVGVQKGFDPKRLSQLWQAMGSFLHTALPKHGDDSPTHYASPDKIKPKLKEALAELDRLAEGTMIGAMVFEQVSFECNCGQLNKRALHGLVDGATVNCINENCKEQFTVEKTDNDFMFEARSLKISCYSCSKEARFPFRAISELPNGRSLHFFCKECGAKNYFAWKLMHLTNPPDTKSAI